jgi:hypothetical protein
MNLEDDVKVVIKDVIFLLVFVSDWETILIQFVINELLGSCAIKVFFLLNLWGRFIINFRSHVSEGKVVDNPRCNVVIINHPLEFIELAAIDCLIA